MAIVSTRYKGVLIVISYTTIERGDKETNWLPAPKVLSSELRWTLRSEVAVVGWARPRTRGPSPAPPPAGTPGLIGWHELHADDGAKALDFYCGFFGWKKTSDFDIGPMGVYRMFDTGHGEQGGIMTRMPQTPASFWLYYFDIDGVDAAAERVKARGGQIVNGPQEVPGGQWIVQATDLQGAMFALLAPKR